MKILNFFPDGGFMYNSGMIVIKRHDYLEIQRQFTDYTPGCAGTLSSLSQITVKEKTLTTSDQPPLSYDLAIFCGNKKCLTKYNICI